MRNRVEIKKKMDTEIFPIFKKRQSGQAKKKLSMGKQEKNHKIVKNKNIWEEKSKKPVQVPVPAPAPWVPVPVESNRHRHRHRHLWERCRYRHLGCRLSLTGTGTGTLGSVTVIGTGG